MPLDKPQIILAAVNAAGPVGDDPAGWEARVEQLGVQLSAMLDDNSRFSKAIDRVGAAKVFRGAVISVRQERSSTRGVVTLSTGTDRSKTDAITKQDLPGGCEQVRTDRTDSAVGLAMARRMTTLIGHDILAWVFLEPYAGGEAKVRVLVNVEDLGVSRDPLAVQAAQVNAGARRSA